MADRSSPPGQGRQEKEGVRNPHNLPTKICPVCHRAFTWRKKWARDWAQVRYCSDRCRAANGDKSLARISTG